jgi:hypothetical protein
MEQETRELSHDCPVRVSKVGIVLSTNNRRVVWVLKPTEPQLLPGDAVPEVVHANVEAVIFDGQPSPTNMTYARLDSKPNTVTFSSHAFPSLGGDHRAEELPLSASKVHGVAWWAQTPEPGTCHCCQKATSVYKGYNGGQDTAVRMCRRCKASDHYGCQN